MRAGGVPPPGMVHFLLLSGSPRRSSPLVGALRGLLFRPRVFGVRPGVLWFIHFWAGLPVGGFGFVCWPWRCFPLRRRAPACIG